jgi:hypothetical protein
VGRGEGLKPKRKPLPRNIISFEPSQTIKPVVLCQKDLAFQKLKEKLLTSPTTYDFIDSDDEEINEVDDLEGEIDSVLSLF